MMRLKNDGPEDREEQLLTRAEAAKYLRVSLRTLQDWSSSGRLPRVRLGDRCVRFRRVDLLRFVDSAVE
jgi:excisionase family DNA binding protein